MMKFAHEAGGFVAKGATLSLFTRQETYYMALMGTIHSMWQDGTIQVKQHNSLCLNQIFSNFTIFETKEKHMKSNMALNGFNVEKGYT